MLPVVRALAPTTCVSIDTMRAKVAGQFWRRVPAWSTTCRVDRPTQPCSGWSPRPGCPISVCTGAATRPDMQSRATYADVAGEVVSELAEQVAQAERAGSPRSADPRPGFGFAKTGEHNWEPLQRLDELDRLDRPLLVGLSRKAFLGTLLADETGRPRPAWNGTTPPPR